MVELVIGNLCSLLAMITDSISATKKTAKAVLLTQTLSQGIYCIGAIVLKGYSAAVQNCVSIVRNIVATNENVPKFVEWVLMAAAVVFGLMFNNLGVVGLLPVAANLWYSLAIIRFKDNDMMLRGAFAVMVFMFGVFNLFIYNFVGVAANTFIFFTTVISLLKTKKQG